MVHKDYEAMVRHRKHEPDFSNLLRVMRREQPNRFTLYEFILNAPLVEKLAGRKAAADDPLDWPCLQAEAFAAAGYDHTMVYSEAMGFTFPREAQAHAKTVSQNEGVCIRDRASFDAYAWPDPAATNLDVLDQLAERIPSGMKAITVLPRGVLENAVALLGYENMCMLLVDDRELLAEVFDQIGARLLGFVERVAGHEVVGAVCLNDDWGFKTQTMLPPAEMREFVIPWHRKMAAVGHAAGRPVMMHSCGNLAEVMDDIIDDIGIDAKHSYEDTIIPVEQAYERWGSRLAILGGIDVDFVCRTTPDEVYKRSREMLERSAGRGGYALGTGNSVPDYVPDENYFAMIAAVID